MAAAIAAAALSLALPAAPGRAADWSQARTIIVVATNYQFQPDHIELQRGVPYRLHFENRGTELHEFHAVELFRHSEIRNPEALDADRTQLVVQPGEQKDLLFVPLNAGEYPLICPDHDWAGMTGGITVN